MAVLYVQMLIFVYLLFHIMRSIFFGELRATESEHLTERLWHAILETCLAFTVFRDDFSQFFVMQFVLLLFIKSFHWLSDDRVDAMEQSPVITLKYHMRMLSLIGILGAIDSFLVSHAYFVTLARGASSQVVFGFEYAVLMTVVIHVAYKYIIHTHDLRSAQAWENKAMYLLFGELAINLVRSLLYGAFAMVMIRVHTLPLFSIRPFYQSLRNLHKAFHDVIMSRRAINAMNSNFPVVTGAELEAMDATCIICREEMAEETSPRRLPCTHVFHSHCLRSWFQRQQTCPTCRTEILGRQNANPAAPNQPQRPQGIPQVFPLFAHQVAAHFVPNQQPQQQNAAQFQPAQGPFPHQIVYAAAPANRPEFMMPPPLPPFMRPLMMQGMPPIPPPFHPPQPSNNLGSLTDEQLRALEGTTREAVIARINHLNDIQTLLDTVNAQMMNYLASSGTNPRQEPETQQPQPTTPSPSVSAQESTLETPTTPAPTTPASINPGATPKSIFTEPSLINGTTVQPSTSADTTSPDQEELRRRRLARFGNQLENGDN